MVQVVVDDDLLRVDGNIRVVHPEHPLGPGLGSEQGEDAGPAADIEDGLVLEEVFILVNGVPVGEGSHGVPQHHMVDVWLRVGAVVIILTVLILVWRRTVNLASTPCSLCRYADRHPGWL